jgi:hypothetical protein
MDSILWFDHILSSPFRKGVRRFFWPLSSQGLFMCSSLSRFQLAMLPQVLWTLCAYGVILVPSETRCDLSPFLRLKYARFPAIIFLVISPSSLFPLFILAARTVNYSCVFAFRSLRDTVSSLLHVFCAVFLMNIAVVCYMIPWRLVKSYWRLRGLFLFCSKLFNYPEEGKSKILWNIRN